MIQKMNFLITSKKLNPLMSSFQAIRNYSAILSFKTLIFIVYLFFFIDERFYTHKFIIL